MKKVLSGFTLVELLIAMGIMTILILILSQVFGSILSVRGKNEATTSLAQDSRYLLQKLSYDVKRATSISSPLAGQSSSSLTMIIGGQTYLYSLSDGVLSLRVGAGDPDRLNSVGTIVTGLNFTRNSDMSGDANISLDLTLTSRVGLDGVDSSTRRIQTTITTR